MNVADPTCVRLHVINPGLTKTPMSAPLEDKNLGVASNDVHVIRKSKVSM